MMLEASEAAEIPQIAREFGGDGSLEALRGERDLNFLAGSGAGKFVLKIVSPADADRVMLQIAALQHIARVAPVCRVPRAIVSADGSPVLPLGERLVWAVSYVDGPTLAERPLRTGEAVQLGELAGQLVRALSTFEHHLLTSPLEWSSMNVMQKRPMLEFVEDRHAQDLAARAFDYVEAKGRLAALPRAPIHGDLNPHNVVVERDERLTAIDFGDLHLGIRAAELAVALCYQLDLPPDALNAVRHAFERNAKLTSDEREALVPLMAARFAMTIVITSRRARERPANRAYLQRNAPIALRGLERLFEDDGIVSLRNELLR